ncbi:MAG: hypothetical protein NTW10_00410 [Bacteroidetes bacterium]|nr:hypothetical protein [Bacteroidota bacterium]
MRAAFYTVVIFLFCLVLMISCNNKNKPVTPCDSMGTICFNNKTDSTVRITIKEAPDQFPLEKNTIKCVSLDGNVLYSINITGKKYEKDTSFVVQVCDKKDFVILR